MRLNRAEVRRGSAALYALILLTVIGILSMTTLQQSLLTRQMLEHRVHVQQAQWLARSGIESAAAAIQAKPDQAWTGAKDALAILPDAQVLVSIERDEAKPGQYRIRAEAEYPREGSRVVRKTLEAVAVRDDKSGKLALEILEPK